MTRRPLFPILYCLLFTLIAPILGAQITVDFKADIREGCSSAQVQFTDESASTSGKIVAWDWDLGGASSDLEEPGRIFSSIGSYKICLTVTDEEGNTASACKDNFINIYDLPSANFDADVISGCAPLYVSYKDLSESPNGSIIEWTWGLNGSNGIIETSDSERPIFTEYDAADSYTISLAVTDEKGCTNSITKNNFIEVIPKPEIKISTAEPIGCAFPMVVDFQNLGDSDGITYHWDFGNGESYEGFDPEPITYMNKDAYQVEIIAVNSISACTDTLTLYDHINSGGTILFDFYPKSICQKGSVQFEDLSPIEADEWEWDFGDGSKSEERDPSHVYADPGSYVISLKRKTAECEGTQTSQFKVEVQPKPILDFEIDKDNTCKLPASVDFKANGPVEGLYRWYIGEQGNYDATLKDQNSTFEFTAFGNYEVRLLVDNEIGCRTFTLIDTVTIEPFEAEVVGNTEGCVPFTAEMQIGSNSTSALTSIQWNISGNQDITSTESSLSVDINEVSNFNVEVFVENQVGCVDTIREESILRGGNMPNAEFGLSDDEICPRELISFIDMSDGIIDTWNWTFGDSTFSYVENPEMTFTSPGEYDVTLEVGHNGCYNTITKDSLFVVNFPGVSFELEYNCENPFLVKALSNSSSFDSLVWSYSIGGETTFLPHADSLEVLFPNKEIYTISLQAFNFDNGCENTVSDTVWISDPSANFNMSQYEGCRPLDIAFTDESIDAVSWKYFTQVGNFSDDTIPSPTIRISPAGEYEEIGLIVTGRHGCQDTTYTPTVRVNRVDALFETPDPICISDTLYIEENSTSIFSTITDLSWTLGDNLDTSSTHNAGFVLSEIGKHDIKLVAEDEWGCKDSITTGLAAYFRAPNFELEADSLSCTTHEIDFRNKLHSNDYTYKWFFGDGDSSSMTRPKHMYREEGDYLVTVRIEDDEACVNEVDLEHLIKIADPVASFMADNTFASCPPLVTSFSNASQNGVEYLWNFGDASGVSSEADPDHLYVTAGIFDVELVVVRSEHCKDTVLLADLIQLDGPKGDFTFEVDSSCVPLSVSFEAELAEDYSLIWDFGDGNLQVIEERTDFSAVDYTYEDPGDFIPKIILEDNENCKITRDGDPIQTHALEADFTSLDSIYCNTVPESVIFNNTSYSSSPQLSFEWLIGSDQYGVENPAYAVSDTGSFDVQLIVSNAYCSDTLLKQNYLNVGEAPILHTLSDTFNCINTELILQSSSESQEDVFLWMDEMGEVLSSTSELHLESLSVDQFFIVQAKNDYECTSTDTIEIEVIDDQTPFAGPDKTICYGDEVEIEIAYGENVEVLAGTSCTDCKILSLAPDSMTLYIYQVTNDYGCLVRDTLQVDVLYQDDIDAGDDQNVCISERPTLLAFAEGDVKWSPTQLLDDPNAFITSANIQESTLFYLESTVDECTLMDSVYVQLLEKADIAVVGDTVCYGDLAHVLAGGDIDDVRWESPGPPLSDMNIFNPTSNTTTSTRFMAIGSLGACTPDTAYADVMVHPEIKAHLPEQRNYFRGTEEIEVEVKVTSAGEYAYTWMPADLVDCVSCPSVLVKTADTSHIVAVEVLQRESACVDTLSVMIRQYYGCERSKAGIGVPNVFSPNEDGFNDVLNIESPAFDDVKSVSIFDRWGQKVFYTTGKEESWDGRHNGEPVQNGVYSYMIQATCPDTGELVTASGDVTVIR